MSLVVSGHRMTRAVSVLCCFLSLSPRWAVGRWQFFFIDGAARGSQGAALSWGQVPSWLRVDPRRCKLCGREGEDRCHLPATPH